MRKGTDQEFDQPREFPQDKPFVLLLSSTPGLIRSVSVLLADFFNICPFEAAFETAGSPFQIDLTTPVAGDAAFLLQFFSHDLQDKLFPVPAGLG